MKRLLCLSLFVAAPAFAAELQHRPIEALKENFSSFREAWDRTGQFCFKEGVGKTCLDLTRMGEVKVRDKGQTLLQLSPSAEAAAKNFDKLYIRYLSVGAGNQFAVHIFFDSKTIFAFGRIDGTVAVVDAFSYSSEVELQLEAALYVMVRGAQKPEDVKFLESYKANTPEGERELNEAVIQFALPALIEHKKGLIQIAQEVVNNYLKNK